MQLTVPPPTTAEPRLGAVVLPAAPRVERGTGSPRQVRRAPAVLLLLLGAFLVIGPVVGGLFGQVAAGRQLIDSFEPHLTPDALGRYDTDLATLRDGAAALNRTYGTARVPAGRYPGLEEYRTKAPAIDARASALLRTVRAAEPDYRRVADIGGFDRVPFLLVVSGLGFAYAGGALLVGARRSGGLVLIGLASGAVLIAYPLLAGLTSGAAAADRLQESLAPVMTERTVLAEQRDFVVLVHAVGELDTGFRAVPRSRADGSALDAVVTGWPAISSDLAGLVGDLNDNLDNDRALADLDALGPGGVSGLAALPWALIGLGSLGLLATLAARPRRRKDAG